MTFKKVIHSVVHSYPSSLVTSCFSSRWAAALSHVTVAPFLTHGSHLLNCLLEGSSGECSCQNDAR